MKKDNFYYFKKTLFLSIPIAVFVIVRELFDLNIYVSSAIIKTVVKGSLVGITTGVVLGIINVFVKVETFMKQK